MMSVVVFELPLLYNLGMKTLKFDGRQNHFFIADCHFGHGNILKYCNRPFLNSEEQKLLSLSKNAFFKVSNSSVDKMDQTIIDNINNVVGEDDYLWYLGDFCFARDDKKQRIEFYRKRIKCRKIRMIWGNHDDENLIEQVFKKADPSFAGFEQVLLVIEGQKIFLNHYPARSWDQAFHGAWDLYGHVHNLFYNEDMGKLPELHEKNLSERITGILQEYNVNEASQINKRILDIIADELYGINMCLDVGVDRESRFAPWSFQELQTYFSTKSLKWQMRKEALKTRD
jgi:calcineurin-like phosphoesterase family protein